MSTKRLHLVLIGMLCLCMLALLGAVYGATMFLGKQADSLYEAKLRNRVLDEEQLQVVKAKADIEKYKSLADIAKSIVPQDKDQARTIREIVSIAEANGIKLGTITFPNSSLGAAAAPASTSSGDKAAPKTAAPPSQLRPVKSIPGVFVLDITVQSDPSVPASYLSFLNFLDALEHNRRTALVNTISLQPNLTDPNSLTFTLSLSEYIKP